MYMGEDSHSPPSQEQNVTGSTKQERATMCGYALSIHAWVYEPLHAVALASHPPTRALETLTSNG